MRDRAIFFCLMLSLNLISACGPNPTSTPSIATRVATLAISPASSTSVLLRTVTPVSPAPTRSQGVAEVTFRWDLGTNITDVDDVTELAVRLKDRPGILGAFGDEIQITVSYDPQLTTPEKISRILADLGFPVKKP